MSASQFYLLTGLFSLSTLLLLLQRGGMGRYIGFMLVLAACALLGIFLNSMAIVGAAALSGIAVSVGWVRHRRLLYRTGNVSGDRKRRRRTGRTAMFRRVNAGLLASATFGIMLSLIWSNPRWRDDVIVFRTPALHGSGPILLIVIVLILTLLIVRMRTTRREDAA